MLVKGKVHRTPKQTEQRILALVAKQVEGDYQTLIDSTLCDEDLPADLMNWGPPEFEDRDIVSIRGLYPCKGQCIVHFVYQIDEVGGKVSLQEAVTAEVYSGEYPKTFTINHSFYQQPTVTLL